jgi:hypothetical protein
MTIPIEDTVRREKNRIYQRQYYQKNKDYHRLYNYRKRLLTKLDAEIFRIIDIREYSKFKKQEIKCQTNYLKKKDEHKFEKYNGKVLVCFD